MKSQTTIALVQGLTVTFASDTKKLLFVTLGQDTYHFPPLWNYCAFMNAWPSWDEIALHVASLETVPTVAEEYTPEDARRDGLGSYHRTLAEVFPDGFAPKS